MIFGTKLTSLKKISSWVKSEYFSDAGKALRQNIQAMERLKGDVHTITTGYIGLIELLKSALDRSTQPSPSSETVSDLILEANTMALNIKKSAQKILEGTNNLE